MWMSVKYFNTLATRKLVFPHRDYEITLYEFYELWK